MKKDFRKVTSTNFKQIGVPKTILEKYLLLKKRNPKIELLKNVFDLELEL